MDVARELVEQDDERQGALGRRGPVIEGAVARLRQRVPEAHRQLPVENRIAGEPAVFPGAEPEIEHVVRCHFWASSICVMMKSASAST
jgi:hypothetical protein